MALRRVGLRDADSRAAQYPHELSGGQRQRAVIAMALMAGPALLIADEPTTALDVRIAVAGARSCSSGLRAQGLAIVLITHDLGIVAGLADRVVVMYARSRGGAGAGRRPARGTRASLYRGARALGAATRRAARSAARRHRRVSRRDRVSALPGCAFEPRCPVRIARCATHRPALRASGASRRRGVSPGRRAMSFAAARAVQGLCVDYPRPGLVVGARQATLRARSRT